LHGWLICVPTRDLKFYDARFWGMMNTYTGVFFFFGNSSITMTALYLTSTTPLFLNFYFLKVQCKNVSLIQIRYCKISHILRRSNWNNAYRLITFASAASERFPSRAVTLSPFTVSASANRYRLYWCCMPASNHDSVWGFGIATTVYNKSIIMSCINPRKALRHGRLTASDFFTCFWRRFRSICG
jgi:hypothetical protein